MVATILLAMPVVVVVVISRGESLGRSCEGARPPDEKSLSRPVLSDLLVGRRRSNAGWMGRLPGIVAWTAYIGLGGADMERSSSSVKFGR